MGLNAAGLDRERLARMLGMLGSSHDGEVINAARAAERLRREAGLTWPQILAPQPALPEPQREREIESVDDAIAFANEYFDVLSSWERKFVASLDRQRKPASPKQLAILRQIVEKCQAEQGAA